MRSPDAEEQQTSIRCTASTCTCAGFKPGSDQLRSCDRCGHGWVAHASEKLQSEAQPPSSCGPVEVALPGLVFDLSSLVLYGAQAVPVRLKILLDRLYSVLTPAQVGHILHTLGWSLGDYVRGYMLQHPGGKVLDRWVTVTPGEELLILQQFLRFGETRPIVELMTLQSLAAVNHLSDPELNPAPKSRQSNVSTLKSTRGDSGVQRSRPADLNHTVHHFQNLTGGLSLLLPFHFPSSAFHCLAPPTKELVPHSKSKLAERHRQEGGRRERENQLILQQPAGNIKADPDKPNQGWSLRQQHPRFHNDQLDLHRAKQENTSPLPPSLNSSHAPTSSSLHPSISSSSSSPPKISPKSRGSSSSSLSPLPSFSSSFLCPLPTSSFPPPLHPLPSSLCCLPSLSGRKGRVCCGVCGKSFYDKGTLKIHYNAVHLKIKHRCTVAGCTMVFSSLRSRNRHSANPNPRLHTGAGRDVHTHRNTHARTQSETRKHTRVWQDDETHIGLNLQHGCGGDTPPLSRTLRQDTHQNFTPSDPTHRPDPQAPPLGPPPSLVPLVVPAVEKTKRCRHLLGLHTNHAAPDPLPGPASITIATCNSPPGSRDCGVPEEKRGEASTSPLTHRQRRWETGDAMPKKKPRKSCMPVKIEREKVDGRRDEDEEE